VCEAAFSHVNLVRRDAQIGQDAVYGKRFEVFEVGFGELEVVVYQGETRVLGYARQSVFVLVEGDEFAFGGKFVEDGATVSAAAEGDIHIGAIWVCNQGIHAGVKKDGVVVVVHTQTVGQRPDALLNLGCVVGETTEPTETFQRRQR
jgi:hypothetical protein